MICEIRCDYLIFITLGRMYSRTTTAWVSPRSPRKAGEEWRCGWEVVGFLAVTNEVDDRDTVADVWGGVVSVSGAMWSVDRRESDCKKISQIL